MERKIQNIRYIRLYFLFPHTTIMKSKRMGSEKWTIEQNSYTKTLIISGLIGDGHLVSHCEIEKGYLIYIGQMIYRFI